MVDRKIGTAVALAAAGLALSLAPVLGAALGPILHKCPPCMRAANTFVRADIGPSGSWVLGTTGGDPGTSLDDDRRLLYGFNPGGSSDLGSSFTTLRTVGPAGVVDEVPAVSASQVDHGDRVETVWLGRARYRTRVTETLQVVANPYSGRPDAVQACYALQNEDTAPLSLGLRALLDVQIGDNDGAPYLVPGVGAVTHEREFVGADVPPFWLAFESPVFDPGLLRSLGLLSADGLTTPDRFLIADWPHIIDEASPWDYPVNPAASITTDSAVALYWDPATVAPGAVRTVCSLYGVAGDRGGSAFLTAPLEVECGASFVAAFFVNNFDPQALTGGLATLYLPPGLALATGEVATKPMGPIAPGGTGSATWTLRAPAGGQGARNLRAEALFDGSRSYRAEAGVTLTCRAPTPTPTRTASATPSPTALPTLTRTPKPSATPTPFGTPGDLARICPFLVGRVPRVAIDAALANPEAVRGWLERLNPGLPAGPNNPLKTWLSIQNIAAPYHPVFNALVFKVGCP